MPRGFLPRWCRRGRTHRSRGDLEAGSGRSLAAPESGAVGGLIVGCPRRPASPAAAGRSRRATKPSSVLLKAIVNGLVLNSRVPTGSNWTPRFMLSVGSPASCVVSIVDSQPWTLTLNRKGPFGDAQIWEVAHVSLMTIPSSRLGSAGSVVEYRRVGSRPSMVPSDEESRRHRPSTTVTKGSWSSKRSRSRDLPCHRLLPLSGQMVRAIIGRRWVQKRGHVHLLPSQSWRSCGLVPAGLMVVTTSRSPVLITETLSEDKLAT